MQLYKPSETAEVVVSSYSTEAQAWSPLAASIIQHTFPYTGQPVSLMEDCCKVDIKLIFFSLDSHFIFLNTLSV